MRIDHLQRFATATALLVSRLAALGALSAFEIPSTFASERALTALLDSPSRPTMEQVVDALRDEPSAELGRFAKSGNEDRLLQIYDMPQVIAFMEKAFPGATWAPLGRDAVIFGDLLNAFYLTIGQQGRVVRLNASGASFQGVEPTLSELRLKLLQSAGFSLKDAQDRTIVGLDRTGFAEKSQSASLMRAGYQAYVREGGKPEDLIPHLNFMALEGKLPDKNFGPAIIDKYFDEVSVGAGTISEIMRLPIGNWTDSTAWHDTFGPLKVAEDGRAEAAPGVASRPHFREAVLREMIQIYLQVSTRYFVHAVQDAAQKSFGYRFPMTERECAELRDASWPAMKAVERIHEGRALIERTQAELPEQGLAVIRAATTAKEVLEWWSAARARMVEINKKHAQGNERLKKRALPAMILSALPEVAASGKMPEPQLIILLRTLFARIEGAQTEQKAELQSTIYNLYRRESAFRKLLNRYASQISANTAAGKGVGEDHYSALLLARIGSQGLSLAPLLDRPTRPSMQDVLRAREAFPRVAPDPTGRSYTTSPFAETIALLEGTFPGAIWAISDSGAERFGSALEAFYASIGQKGRVVRLPSLENDPHFLALNPEQKRWERVRIMESLGLELLNPEARPFIVLGGASKNNESYDWLSTLYDAYYSVGGTLKSEPFARFNRVQLKAGYWSKTPFRVRDQYFLGLRGRGLTQPTAMIVPSGAQSSPYEWTDLADWNDPSLTNDAREAKNMDYLQRMYYLAEAVTSPKFLAHVLTEARAQGYMFPTAPGEWAQLGKRMTNWRHKLGVSRGFFNMTKRIGNLLSRNPGIKMAKQLQVRPDMCAGVFEGEKK